MYHTFESAFYYLLSLAICQLEWHSVCGLVCLNQVTKCISILKATLLHWTQSNLLALHRALWSRNAVQWKRCTFTGVWKGCKDKLYNTYDSVHLLQTENKYTLEREDMSKRKRKENIERCELWYLVFYVLPLYWETVSGFLYTSYILSHWTGNILTCTHLKESKSPCAEWYTFSLSVRTSYPSFFNPFCRQHFFKIFFYQ